MNDRIMLDAYYVGGQAGRHILRGQASLKAYGYRAAGDRVRVEARDVAAAPDRFRCWFCRKPFKVVGHGVHCPCDKTETGQAGASSPERQADAGYRHIRRPDPPPVALRPRVLEREPTEEDMKRRAAERTRAEAARLEPYIPRSQRSPAPEADPLPPDTAVHNVEWQLPVNRSHLRALDGAEVETVGELRELGVHGLSSIKHIGEQTAEEILRQVGH
jgi:hypothetical protein